MLASPCRPCHSLSAPKSTPGLRVHAPQLLQASLPCPSHRTGLPRWSHDTSTPPRLVACRASGPAVLERKGLKVSQTIKQQGPQLDNSGSGGGIGNKVFNAGGGGGDDDDDDDYFQPGGDDEGDDSKWWHRIPLQQLYDAETVRAVLSEWGFTIQRLPLVLQLVASTTYYSSAQWVRYLTMQERPNMFRSIERTLSGIPYLRANFVGRMLADPAFMQKTGVESAIAFTICLAEEAHTRGSQFRSNLDCALVNASCMAAAAAVCTTLTAPCKVPATSPVTAFPWQPALRALPNNVLEKSTPARAFLPPQRMATIAVKAVELSTVYALAAAISAGVQRIVLSNRAQKKGTQRKAARRELRAMSSVSQAAGGAGVYGAVVANARLQAVTGLEMVLLDYAKASTTWQIMGLALLARGLSMLAVENPLADGPQWLVGASRAGLQGCTAEARASRLAVARNAARSKPSKESGPSAEPSAGPAEGASGELPSPAHSPADGSSLVERPTGALASDSAAGRPAVAV